MEKKHLRETLFLCYVSFSVQSSSTIKSPHKLICAQLILLNHVAFLERIDFAISNTILNISSRRIYHLWNCETKVLDKDSVIRKNGYFGAMTN